MSLIDWSDPEEMLGLLVEFVADERLEERSDRERAAFLEELSSAIRDLARKAADLSTGETIEGLRHIADSVASEFAGDPAMIHVEDCIQELEQIRRRSSTP